MGGSSDGIDGLDLFGAVGCAWALLDELASSTEFVFNAKGQAAWQASMKSRMGHSSDVSELDALIAEATSRRS